MKTALTVAGSDCSGGAGIQADIKTMSALGVYAMSAITALTAQNTMGVTGISEVSPEFLGEQLDAVFTDIRPDAVKIGMISNPQLIEITYKKLKEYKAENIVVDPVMVSTSGARLSSHDAVRALSELLFPIAAVITPNIPEAEILSGIKINSPLLMTEAAKIIGERFNCSVLLKGGHSVEDANDILCENRKSEFEITKFEGKRIDNSNTHGTGCTLSSAIAAGLAKGLDLHEAVKAAKEYLSGALADGLDLGHGSGPLNHMYILK